MTRSISKRGFSWDDMLTRRAGHTLAPKAAGVTDPAAGEASVAPPPPPPDEGVEAAAQPTIDTAPLETRTEPAVGATMPAPEAPVAAGPEIGPATDASVVERLTAASRAVAPSATFGEARATRADKEREEPSVSPGEELRYGDLRIAVGPRSLRVDSTNDDLSDHHPEDGAQKLTALQKFVLLTSAGRPLVVLLIPQVVDANDGLTNEQRAAAALVDAEKDDINAAAGEQTTLDGDPAAVADKLIAESEALTPLRDEERDREQLRMMTTPPTSKLIP